MRPALLLIEPMMPQIEAALDAAYEVYRLGEVQGDVDAIAGQIRAVATGGGSGLKTELMDRLQRLEIIAINGIGTDAVDLVRARERDIAVTTTPDVLTDDVADQAMALLLAVFRDVVVGDRFVRSGAWMEGRAMPLSRKLSGKRLGILGMGRVGRAIAQRAAAFGLAIAYMDLRPVDVPYRFEADLAALARDSNALVVAAAGGPGSKGIVNAAVLQALGPDGVLVNVARGSVVDEAALVAALQAGRLGAAGLDVFADEPRAPAALFAMDRVVLQPHRASATLETRLAMGQLVLKNLDAHFAGRPLLTPVD